jgi:hypothetical protein
MWIAASDAFHEGREVDVMAAHYGSSPLLLITGKLLEQARSRMIASDTLNGALSGRWHRSATFRRLRARKRTAMPAGQRLATDPNKGRGGVG